MFADRLRVPIVLTILLTAGCGARGNAAPIESSTPTATVRKVVVDAETLKRLGVHTQKVGDVEQGTTISVPGSLEYDLAHYAEVGPRLDGRVTVVHAKLGDRVKRGDVLAEMAVPALSEAQASALTAAAGLHAAKKNADREAALLGKALTTARESETADAELVKANAAVAAADARLHALGVKAGGVGGVLRLISPIDGVVIQRSAVLGGFLSVSANAFAVADTTVLVALLDVHEADMQHLRLGSNVTFTADGLPNEKFKGKLTFIDPTVNKTTRLVRARVGVPNPEDKLRPGMFVRAQISIPSNALGGGVLLPTQAVQPLGADDVVFVETAPGTFEIRKVYPHHRTSEVVVVDSGVSKGEVVVIEGAFLLRGEAAKQ